MRIYSGTARYEKSVINHWLASAQAISSIAEFSGADAFAKTHRQLLVPSAFVSGQRTR